jgi:hypothetical protein
MPHGFLSYNFPIFGMKNEALAGIKLGTAWLKELLTDIEPPFINSDLKIEEGLLHKTNNTSDVDAWKEEFKSKIHHKH